MNKVYGISRRISEFETRNIQIGCDKTKILNAAVQDKSSLVRKVAADFLISKREDLTPEQRHLSSVLRKDQSAAVRSRIDFLDRAIADN